MTTIEVPIEAWYAATGRRPSDRAAAANRAKAEPVRATNVKTGEIRDFESASQAASTLRVDNVHRAVRRRITAGGWTFERMR